MNTTAIVTVVGPDRVGIIAEICRTLADLDLNVLEISQTIMSGMFTMIMRVQPCAATPDFETVRARLDAKGAEMGLSVRIQREDIFDAMHTV